MFFLRVPLWITKILDTLAGEIITHKRENRILMRLAFDAEISVVLLRDFNYAEGVYFSVVMCQVKQK